MTRELIKGYCPKCDEIKDFHYVGGQIKVGNFGAVEYYSCDCGTTFTKEKLRLENRC